MKKPTQSALWKQPESIERPVMPSNELFYTDPDGNKQDAELHAELLAGDHSTAIEVSADLMREWGFTEDEIEIWLPGFSKPLRARASKIKLDE